MTRKKRSSRKASLPQPAPPGTRNWLRSSLIRRIHKQRQLQLILRRRLLHQQRRKSLLRKILRRPKEVPHQRKSKQRLKD